MNPWQHGARYWRTLRHLKPRQIGFKVWEAATDRLEPPLAPLLHVWLGRPAGVMAKVQFDRLLPLVAFLDRCASPQHRQRLVSEFRRGEFTAAGQTARVISAATQRPDWAPAGTSPLFRYHLHYGHDLLAAAFAAHAESSTELFEIILERMREWATSVRIGDPAGWRPYPLSVRLSTWSAALTILDTIHPVRTSQNNVIFESMNGQLKYLRWHVEHAVDGNHLLRNFVGLLVGGVFLSDQACVQDGEKGLRRLLAEHWLPDGGYIERCPGYQVTATCDLAEAHAVAEGSLRADMAVVLERAARWLAVTLHPDATVPRFGDTTLETQPQPLRLLEALGHDAGAMGCHWLADSGLLVTRTARDHLAVDLGPLGADHQPGHAHADIGAFEWSVAGERVIVDTGVPGYDGHPERLYARSAAAHNVAVADGRDHAELWATFRVGWRPTVARSVEMNGAAWQATLSWSDDFQPPTIQMRRVLRWQDHCLTVEDEAEGAVSLVVRLVLHPLASASRQTDGWLLRRHNGSLRLVVEQGEVTLLRAPVWQRMGEQELAPCLELRGSQRLRWHLTSEGAG